MSGAKLLKDAPETIKVSCYLCKLEHEWKRRELLDKGVGPNASMPDLLHGLARLLKCERWELSEQERKSKPCMLKYVDLWE